MNSIMLFECELKLQGSINSPPINMQEHWPRFQPWCTEIENNDYSIVKNLEPCHSFKTV